MPRTLVFAVVTLCSTHAAAVSLTPDVAGVNGFTAIDRVSWLDSKGLLREMDFAKVYPNPIFPQIQGYVTRLSWQPEASATRIVAAEDPAGINAGNAQGWGGTVFHMHYSQAGGVNPYVAGSFAATTHKRDGYDFVQGPRFVGPSHLIYRVSFKQYTTLIRGQSDDRKSVDVTIDWFVADGFDHVIYALSIDATREFIADDNPFHSDNRSPYCLFTASPSRKVTDWAGGDGAPDGQSWGDTRTFMTTDMKAWSYSGTNTIPYVWMWSKHAHTDAEAAFVQTETYTRRRAGSGFNDGLEALGDKLPTYPNSAISGSFFAYQLNYYDAYKSKRLTWGSHYGAIDGGLGSVPAYQNYSLAMHIGKHTDGGAQALLRETEAIHSTFTVSATAGKLVKDAPDGTGNAPIRSLSPAGFNHVYRLWEAEAGKPCTSLVFELGAGSYRKPLIVLRDAAQEVDVAINGASTTDYLGSYDAAAKKLYITLNQTLTGTSIVRMCARGDQDADTVTNELDICPATANTTQADVDGDGAGDVCDNCNSVANPNQRDDDRDGLGNACDNCPGARNEDQKDDDGDGIGDACEQAEVVESTEQATPPARRGCHAAVGIEVPGSLVLFALLLLRRRWPCATT